jgi:hypothetical protein
VDDQKGPTWFQQQMTDWLSHLTGQKKDMGEDYESLRLLTKDLSEIDKRVALTCALMTIDC